MTMPVRSVLGHRVPRPVHVLVQAHRARRVTPSASGEDASIYQDGDCFVAPIRWCRQPDRTRRSARCLGCHTNEFLANLFRERRRGYGVHEPIGSMLPIEGGADEVRIAESGADRPFASLRL